jgi:hypothetical protein
MGSFCPSGLEMTCSYRSTPSFSEKLTSRTAAFHHSGVSSISSLTISRSIDVFVLEIPLHCRSARAHFLFRIVCPWILTPSFSIHYVTANGRVCPGRRSGSAITFTTEFGFSAAILETRLSKTFFAPGSTMAPRR